MDSPSASAEPVVLKCAICGAVGSERRTADIAISVPIEGQKPKQAFVAFGFRIPGSASDSVPILCADHHKQLLSAAVIQATK